MGARSRIVVAVTAVLLTMMTGSAMATAEPRVGEHDADVDVRLAGGANVLPDGTWYTHSGPLRFAIDVTNSGSSDEDGVEVAVRVPDTVDLRIDSRGWECVDMAGGVSCRSEVPTAPGQRWPYLQAEINSGTFTQGSILVGARPGLNGVPEPGENQLEQSIIMVGDHDADVELTPDESVGMRPGDEWYVHGHPLPFAITVTNSGPSDEDGVEVAVRVPDTVDLRVDGDGWDCVDVEGGVTCQSEIPTTPGEQWPELQASLVAHANTQDSMFVGVRPGLNGVPVPGENEVEQRIFLDTSV